MTEPIKVSDAERELATSGSAPFSNKFYVTVGPVVRLSFAEQWGPESPPQLRAAVTMLHSDAIELKNVLTRVLADIEKQIADAQAIASSQNQAGTQGDA